MIWNGKVWQRKHWIGKYRNEIHRIKVEKRDERGSIGGMDWQKQEDQVALDCSPEFCLKILIYVSFGNLPCHLTTNI